MKLAVILHFVHVFRPFTHIIMVCHTVYCAYLIPWPRKCRFRHKNHEVISEILEISDFEAAILKNGWKLVVSPSFFSGNIANMIPVPGGPLNKMVPLMEDHGGGGGGGGEGWGVEGARGPPLAHGLWFIVTHGHQQQQYWKRQRRVYWCSMRMNINKRDNTVLILHGQHGLTTPAAV